MELFHIKTNCIYLCYYIMRILLTGATGYIGKRLLPALVELGHHVICCVRDRDRFNPPDSLLPHIDIIEIDLAKKETLKYIPKHIDGAYYLVHSMASTDDFKSLEELTANNFVEAIQHTNVKHLIYLGGMVNEDELSEHLRSRKNVEDILAQGSYHFTALRAGIIIGSGSASFEIIRDLVEKLPLMVTPKWLNTRCQSIGIVDVISFLSLSLFNPKTFDNNFDIGGADILTYKEMLLHFAQVRALKRFIFTLPIMTPRLSSYWLYFVTSTSYNLAVSLVDSMKVEVVSRDNELAGILGIEVMGYDESLKRAFQKIESNEIVSSWKDAFASSGFKADISDYIKVPTFGVFTDERKRAFNSREQVLENIWQIGGETGWYAGNWLWQLRGYLDKLVGGVGLRRGRTNVNSIHAGDALDFWRVLYANREEGRLLLYAEMKLPGEAWLEFKVNQNEVIQTATFRPLGIAGRLYWFAVLPFHGFIFNGMLKSISTST